MKHQTSNDYSKKWLGFIGIALLSFGCYLDYTVVNVALPTIQRELETNLVSLQWVMNIYFLALCVLATIMGRLGDKYGRRRCFYIGTGIFALASIVAGFSPNINTLIFGRLLQGIGAAVVFPLGMSLLPYSFPLHERGKSIAWLGSMGGVALALGPVLGGAIVTNWGWRWIFFINLPIIVIGFLFCLNSVKESMSDKNDEQLDWKGMFLLAVGLSGIILSLIHSQTYGWNNFLSCMYLVVGIMASIILIKVERAQKDPLIDFSDFSNILFYAGAVLCSLAGMFSAVALFFDPLYLQIIRQETPQFSGFVLFAIPIAVFAIAFMVHRFISILGILNTILFAVFLGCLSAVLQVFFSETTPLWYVVISFIFLGSLWAMGNTVSIIAAQAAVDPSRMSVATGTMVTMFNIGGSVGLAISVVVYQFVTSSALQKIHEASPEQFIQLEKLLSNPASSLQTALSGSLHQLFNNIFIHGFVGVMLMLVLLSSLGLLSIFLWNKRSS